MISTHTTLLQSICSQIANYDLGHAVRTKEYKNVVDNIRNYLTDSGITSISFNDFQKLTRLPYAMSRYILIQELKGITITNIKVKKKVV